MTRSLSVNLSRALSLALSVAAAGAAAAGVRGRAVPDGSIVGLFSNGATGGCDLWRLSPSTGNNATVATSLAMCAGVDQYFPSVATRTAAGALVVAIGTGSHVFSIDVSSGAQTPLAPMPALNDSNWPLGVVAAPADKLYVVFQNDVMEVAGGKLTRLPIDISVPQYAQVTSCPTCGTGGSPVIFVADEASTTIFCFDLGAMDAPYTIKSGVNGDMDLQWSESLAALIEVASYTLYKTDPTTGKSTRIGYVPDGPGYPRVNTLSPDGGSTIWICDFVRVPNADAFLTEFPGTHEHCTLTAPAHLPKPDSRISSPCRFRRAPLAPPSSSTSRRGSSGSLSGSRDVAGVASERAPRGYDTGQRHCTLEKDPLI